MWTLCKWKRATGRRQRCWWQQPTLSFLPSASLKRSDKSSVSVTPIKHTLTTHTLQTHSIPVSDSGKCILTAHMQVSWGSHYFGPPWLPSTFWTVVLQWENWSMLISCCAFSCFLFLCCCFLMWQLLTHFFSVTIFGFNYYKNKKIKIKQLLGHISFLHWRFYLVSTSTPFSMTLIAFVSLYVQAPNTLPARLYHVLV